MMDEDFVMYIFRPLQGKNDPFDEYLIFIFEEKTSKPVNWSNTSKDKVVLFDHLHTELFYTTRMENHQITQACCNFL
jgi:hypothetical protein